MADPEKTHLPQNALTRLKEGEVYTPIVHASEHVTEISFRSVTLGLLMAVLFSGAATFLGLKIAQVFEAAIPIAIISVGISAVCRRKSTILENVIVQSIGAASGHIVAGAIFTLPALFILGLGEYVNLAQLFIAASLGGVIGVLSIIPMRRYFVEDMHGRLPFPEATATTGIIVAGTKKGSHSKILLIAALVGGVYDFLSIAMHAWGEEFTTALVKGLAPITDKFKLVFSINTGAAVMGLGYIVGLRYAIIIACGSFLSWFVFVPLFNYFGNVLQNLIPISSDIQAIIPPATIPLAGMTANQIFTNYVRPIGLGAIFAAGLIGVIKSGPIIWHALTRGIKGELLSIKKHGHEKALRTQRDIPMPAVIIIALVLLIATWFFFKNMILVGQLCPLKQSLIAMLIVFVISFIFTTVAARAIAIVGINPVSGMTLVTLIISCLIMIAAKVSGQTGMMAALLIGGMVCTSLATAGGLITDLKIGYWIGATPSRQQWCKIAGGIVSALTVSAVIILLSKVYGFTESPIHPNPLPAPQANAMAAVINGLMFSKDMPWVLYGIGICITLIMQLLGVAPLAFALGMYIPLSLNTPVLAGALLAKLVEKSAKKDETLMLRRRDKGTLIASGLIAGGASMGVVDAIIKYIETESETKILHNFANDGALGNLTSLIMFALLCGYIYYGAVRKTKHPNGGQK